MIYNAKTIDDLYKNNVVKLVREKKYEPCDMIYDDICMCERHFFTVPNQTFLNKAFTTLQYCNNIKELYLWDLGLKDDTLITFPPLLESLDISINKLTKLPTIPESVIILVCSKNRLINIDLPVNSKVQRLFCSNNRITSLNNLSSNIWELKCSDNDISTLDNLPPSVGSLDCSYNKITTLDNLPQGITRLECNNCLLEQLDNLPPNMQILRCQNNKIIKLHNLPEKIRYIYYDNNPCYNDEITIKLVEKLRLKNKFRDFEK
jgi:hypothetical protein